MMPLTIDVNVIDHQTPSTPTSSVKQMKCANGTRANEPRSETIIGGNVSPAPEKAPSSTISTAMNDCDSARIIK